LGDHIRIALDHSKSEQVFKDKSQITPLSKKEMKLSKLGALSLFVSQGITMIHAGQEWARSKVVHDPNGIDPKKGQIDRDSYNKDDETNWLNFNEISLNKSLFNYYQGLIKLRLNAPALRKSAPEAINFKVYNDPLHVTFSIDGKSSGDMYDYFVSLNAHKDHAHEIILPDGYWEVIVNPEKAGLKTLRSVEKSMQVPASSGIVLRKLRVSKA
jgi:pullulanase/glycogen debranching enzyme